MIDAPCCSLPAPEPAYTNQRIFVDGIECSLLVHISSGSVYRSTLSIRSRKAKRAKNTLASLDRSRWSSTIAKAHVICWRIANLFACLLITSDSCPTKSKISQNPVLFLMPNS